MAMKSHDDDDDDKLSVGIPERVWLSYFVNCNVLNTCNQQYLLRLLSFHLLI